MKRNVRCTSRAALLSALVVAAVIFSSCATGRKITVLTYNTHLFAGSYAQHANVLKYLGEAKEDLSTLNPRRILEPASTAPLVLDDDTRADQIAQRLARSGADIVALQELWSCDRPRWFAERLRTVYPYHYYYTERCPEVKPEEFRSDLLRVITTHVFALDDAEQAIMDMMRSKNYTIMNGLLLLSKYEISDAEFHQFPEGRMKGEEQLAHKGVITATIVLPNGSSFRVGVTHATTNVVEQDQRDIADLAGWTTGAGKEGMGKMGPAIMMGDLNVRYTQVEVDKYKRMTSVFGEVEAIDAYRQVNKRTTNTVDFERNRLMPFFSPGSKSQACLDYVFYRPDGPNLTMRAEAARVISDWKYMKRMEGKAEEIDLSDHYPVAVMFSLWNGSEPVRW